MQKQARMNIHVFSSHDIRLTRLPCSRTIISFETAGIWLCHCRYNERRGRLMKRISLIVFFWLDNILVWDDSFLALTPHWSQFYKISFVPNGLKFVFFDHYETLSHKLFMTNIDVIIMSPYKYFYFFEQHINLLLTFD